MISNHTFRVIALYILTILCYGFYNAYLPITDPVESNYVLSAITMLHHNSWISPMIYDQFWYDKPPFTYWALMICYKLFGISDFVSRIPNTLTAGGSVALLYHLVYRIKQSTPIAVASAIALFSTLQFWYISHAVITDGFLFLFSLAIFGYSYLAFSKHDGRSMVKAYIAAALAVLTKGPVGIVLPGLILLVYIGIRWYIHRHEDRSYRFKQDLQLLCNPVGVLLFSIVASPWYIAMYYIHGQDFISGFLGLHNMDRALVSEHPKFNVWYYYLVVVPLALLPWTPAVLHKVKSLHWRDDLNVLGVIWFVIIVLFYSLVATKYLTYTLPAIIPCMIWAGTHIYELLTTNTRWFKYVVTCPFYIYLGILTIAAGVSPDTHLMPMIIATILILICVLLTQKSIRSNTQFAMYLTAPLVLLYAGITIAVAPVLMNQSGLQFKNYMPTVSHRTYIYGSYYTSILYYTNVTPIQVLVPTTDDPRWTAGKTLMPAMSKTNFINSIVHELGAIIIVPNKYNEEFRNLPVFPAMKETGKTSVATIYKVIHD